MNDYMKALHQRFFREPDCTEIRRELETLRLTLRDKLDKQDREALLKLAEGDYQQVEKLMAKNADHAEQPVVNYLLAAEAAQQRGDEARANQHLERAAELAGNDTIPVEITRVRLQTGP